MYILHVQYILQFEEFVRDNVLKGKELSKTTSCPLQFLTINLKSIHFSLVNSELKLKRNMNDEILSVCHVSEMFIFL